MTARQLALKVLYEVEKNGAYPGIELKKQLSDYEKIKSYFGIDKIKELLQTITISMRKKDKTDR